MKTDKMFTRETNGGERESERERERERERKRERRARYRAEKKTLTKETGSHG